MLFFTRILKLKQETITQREQRQSERYAVNPSFPLHVMLNPEGREVQGAAVNLSASGIAVQFSAEVSGIRGKTCSCVLEVERHRLEIPAEIAHLQSLDGRTSGGVVLRFNDFATKMAYLQLLEAVAMGASLKPTDAGKTEQDVSWLKKEQFRGEGQSQLSVWRAAATGEIDSFEFQLDDYFVRGHAKSPQLEVYTQEMVKDLHKSGYSVPALKPFAGEGEEIGRLYRWVVPNLARTVPDDIRSFLARHLPPVESIGVPALHGGT